MTTFTIVERIIGNRNVFIKRNKVKEEKEIEVYQSMHQVNNKGENCIN